MGSGLGAVALATVVSRGPIVRQESCEDKGLQPCDILKRGQGRRKAS